MLPFCLIWLHLNASAGAESGTARCLISRANWAEVFILQLFMRAKFILVYGVQTALWCDETFTIWLCSSEFLWWTDTQKCNKASPNLRLHLMQTDDHGEEQPYKSELRCRETGRRTEVWWAERVGKLVILPSGLPVNLQPSSPPVSSASSPCCWVMCCF